MVCVFALLSKLERKIEVFLNVEFFYTRKSREIFRFLNKREFGEVEGKKRTETRTVQILFWENNLGKFI